MTGSHLRIFFASAADVLVDGEGNGEGLIAAGLLRGLVGRGHEVTACVGEDRVGSRPELAIHELDRHGDLQTLQPFLRAARARRVFAEAGGAGAFDIVHWLFPNWAPGLDPRSYAPLPVVVGPLVTDWDAPGRWWPPGFTLRRALNPWLESRRRRMTRSCAALVVAGSWVRPSVPDTNTSIIEVPFGLEAGPATPVPGPGRPFTVLYLGRFDQAKGVADLLAAARLVVHTTPMVRFEFVGDGPLRATLEAAAREAQLVGRVTISPRVEHDAVPALLHAASVLCLPSWGEPFGMVVLEAMAAGRPVIVADAGALAKIVTDGVNGRVVPVRSPVQLAGAIQALAGEPSAVASMGRANLELVQAHYALPVVLARWEAVYRQAIATREHH